MNKETKDQIAREAAQQAIIVENRFKGKNVDYAIIVSQVGGFETGYIAGAETWAERGEVLREALEKILRTNYDNHERVIETVKMIATKALSNYNNPVK